VFLDRKSSMMCMGVSMHAQACAEAMSVQDAQEVKTSANVPVAQGVKRKRAVVSLLWHLRHLPGLSAMWSMR
jgi:hypothetical protein